MLESAYWDQAVPAWPACRKCGGPVREMDTFLNPCHESLEVRVRCHGEEAVLMLTREQAANGEHLKLEAF